MLGWEIVWQEGLRQLAGLSRGASQVRQVVPGPRKESATEIPAMEAMAMTSLKLKLPKVLLPHFYVGARWRCK